MDAVRRDLIRHVTTHQYARRIRRPGSILTLREFTLTCLQLILRQATAVEATRGLNHLGFDPTTSYIEFERSSFVVLSRADRREPQG